MYCKECGKELPEGSKFCSNCGTGVEKEKNGIIIKTEGSKLFDKLKNLELSDKLKSIKSSKKKMISLCIGIALVVVAIILLSFFSNRINRTPESVAENFVVALHTQNPKKLINCLPDFYIEKTAKQYGLTANDKKELIKLMEAEVDEDDIESCEVLKSYVDTSLSEIEEYIENLSKYGVSYKDYSDIEDYSMVSVNCLVGNQNNSFIVFCIKYDGKWYALDID